jgi:hypothetical protein
MAGMAVPPTPAPAEDAGQLPVSALLSQLLVAFTVEFDNEFEHQMPHRTTRHGPTPGAGRAPWLVSMPMWVHCMRYVPEQGIATAELIRRSGLAAKSVRSVVKRMSQWWGYLTVDATAKLVRPTASGLAAQGIWAPLTAVIEDRWQQRFGRLASAGARPRVAAALSGDLGSGRFSRRPLISPLTC